VFCTPCNRASFGMVLLEAMSCGRPVVASRISGFQLVMEDGRRIAPSPSLGDIRARATRDLERLPEPLRRLEPGASYPVEVAQSLVRLGTEVDGRLARQDKAPA